MVTSTSRLAYSDCFDHFERALADEKGTRIKVGSFGDAMYLRTRLHAARSIEREENKRVYDPDHMLYGRSIYDVLVCRISIFDENNQLTSKDNPTGTAWLYIEKKLAGDLEVESLSEMRSPANG